MSLQHLLASLEELMASCGGGGVYESGGALLSLHLELLAMWFMTVYLRSMTLGNTDRSSMKIQSAMLIMLICLNTRFFPVDTLNVFPHLGHRNWQN